MGWQLWTVILIVALAAAYLARMTWRAWSAAGKGCGGGCCGTKEAGKNADQGLIPTDQLLTRLRPPTGSGEAL